VHLDGPPVTHVAQSLNVVDGVVHAHAAAVVTYGPAIAVAAHVWFQGCFVVPA
jgi:hypothetical protein